MILTVVGCSFIYFCQRDQHNNSINCETLYNRPQLVLEEIAYIQKYDGTHFVPEKGYNSVQRRYKQDNDLTFSFLPTFHSSSSSV